MNQRTKFLRRNEVKNQIRIMNRNRNCLKWGSNETDAHICMKLAICKYLKRQKKEFYTEAIFIDGQGRADVVNADDQLIYEIFDTESKESLERKAREYPFPVIFVDANQEFEEEIIN